MEPTQDLYDRAVAIVGTVEQVTPMLLQRRLNIGYGTAKRIIDRLLEAELVVVADPLNHCCPKSIPRKEPQ